MGSGIPQNCGKVSRAFLGTHGLGSRVGFHTQKTSPWLSKCVLKRLQEMPLPQSGPGLYKKACFLSQGVGPRALGDAKFWVRWSGYPSGLPAECQIGESVPAARGRTPPHGLTGTALQEVRCTVHCLPALLPELGRRRPPLVCVCSTARADRHSCPFTESPRRIWAWPRQSARSARLCWQ